VAAVERAQHKRAEHEWSAVLNELGPPIEKGLILLSVEDP
jgi:hypothetical protein